MNPAAPALVPALAGVGDAAAQPGLESFVVALETGAVHEAVDGMNSGTHRLSVQDQSALFAAVPASQLVSGLLASANLADRALGELLSEVAAGNLRLSFADASAVLEQNGILGAEAQSYLAMYLAVHKEAMTALLSGALDELAENPDAADVDNLSGSSSGHSGLGPGGDSGSEGGALSAALASDESFSQLVLPKISVGTDAKGRVVLRGRFDQPQAKSLGLLQDGLRRVQVASLDDVPIESLLGAQTMKSSEAAPVNKIKGWNGGRQVRANGHWVFVRDDGSFEAVLPAGQSGQDVKITMIDSKGVVQERNPMVQPVAGGKVSLAQPRKIALLFANSDYSRSGIPDLTTPANDAGRVSEVLHDKLGFDIRVINNATKADMVQAIRALHSEVTDKDQVMIYYAGHGYENQRTGIGYWLPVDATTGSAKNWISTRDLAGLLRRVPAKNIMLVADSCYSGAFTKEQVAAGSSKVASLEDLQVLRGVVAMSSGGDEPVMDGQTNSPFARAMVDRLNGVSDAQTGEYLFGLIKTDVTAIVPQVPHYGVVNSAGYDPGADYLVQPRRSWLSLR